MTRTGPVARATSLTALALATVLLLAGCGDDAGSGSAGTAAASPGPVSSGASPAATAAGPADVNGDGRVVVGVLSPGDLDDHGYYESFVTSAEAFTTRAGWQLIKVGSVNAADALTQARNLCRQHVDLVALAAADLADAIPASTEPVCARTDWYVPSSGNVEQTPRIALSTDVVNQSLLAAGYAMGLLLKAAGATSAGFVTGPKADYSEAAAKAYLAGIRETLPTATVRSTFTGDFNDSAVAKEATQAQLDAGIGGLYPYLGGATDAAAKLASAKGIPVATPGTDRCASVDPAFAIAVVFDPGVYFGAALAEFARGTLKMGTTRVWQLGRDPVPTVRFCHGTAAQTAALKAFMGRIGDGSIDPDTEVAELGG